MPNHSVSAVIFGGYGTFGRHVARELARRNVRVTVAGRSQEKAAAVARQLGPPHRAIQADVTDRQACLAALKQHRVAVHCAGPFSHSDTSLIEACLDARLPLRGHCRRSAVRGQSAPIRPAVRPTRFDGRLRLFQPAIDFMCGRLGGTPGHGSGRSACPLHLVHRQRQSQGAGRRGLGREAAGPPNPGALKAIYAASAIANWCRCPCLSDRAGHSIWKARITIFYRLSWVRHRS